MTQREETSPAKISNIHAPSQEYFVPTQDAPIFSFPLHIHIIFSINPYAPPTMHAPSHHRLLLHSSASYPHRPPLSPLRFFLSRSCKTCPFPTSLLSTSTPPVADAKGPALPAQLLSPEISASGQEQLRTCAFHPLYLHPEDRYEFHFRFDGMPHALRIRISTH